MYAIILAGGRGKRMGSKTNETPKPMLEVAGKPILRHQIEHYRDHRGLGVTNFILAVGYKGDVIRDYFGDGSNLGVNIIYQDLGLEATTGARVKDALSMVPDAERDVFISNGDTITDLNLENFLARHRELNSPVTVNLFESRSSFGIVHLNSESTITSLTEKPIQKINSGYFVAQRGIHDQLSGEKEWIDELPNMAKGYHDPEANWWHVTDKWDLPRVEEALMRCGEQEHPSGSEDFIPRYGKER